jgi:hypothetical protein
MGKTVVTPPPEPADGVIAVVVIGEKTAELAVVRDGGFLLARSLPAASNLASDIRRNFSVYAGQQPQQPIRAVYVAGKGAGELRERLGEMVEIPVHTFDPFSGSEAPDLPAGNRGSFAGAVGLLHVQATGQQTINFVSPRQPREPRGANFRLIRAAVLAWVVLFVGLLVLGRVVHARMSGDADLYERQRGQASTELTRTRENAKVLRAIDDWDNPVWLDELYELTVRIRDVNALRVTSIQTQPLQRSPQSKVAAQMTIRGKLLSKSNPRKPLDELVNTFSREGYYSPQATVEKDASFTLVVTIERRAPSEYVGRLSGEQGGAKPTVEEGGDRASTTETEKAKTAKGKTAAKGGKTKSKGSTGKGKRSSE